MTNTYQVGDKVEIFGFEYNSIGFGIITEIKENAFVIKLDNGKFAVVNKYHIKTAESR